MSTQARRPQSTSTRRSAPSRTGSAGRPLVYLLALVAVAITLGPVLYGALGGFRSNEQLARDPPGCRTRGCGPTTPTS